MAKSKVHRLTRKGKAELERRKKKGIYDSKTEFLQFILDNPRMYSNYGFFSLNQGTGEGKEWDRRNSEIFAAADWAKKNGFEVWK